MKAEQRSPVSGYLVLILCAAVWPCLAPAAEPIRLGRGPHLLLDDYFIAESSGVERKIREPARHPEPIVTGKEDGNFQPYLTVLRDDARNVFRLWYGIPEHESQTHLAYMESPDGINWIRPRRVLPDPGGKIQFGISIIDDGPDFPDKAKRYKLGWYNDGGLRIATSPDGFDWKPIAPGVVLEHSHDISCIFRDPIRKRYVAIVSSYTTGPNWEGNRRIPMQSVSDDCIHWKKPWVIIMPDKKDEGDTQFYCMGGLIARGGLLVGMLRPLRDDLPAEEGGPVAGIGYTVLAWSRDGETWQRDREAFMPRNPKPGTWDRAMTWADCQLVVGDETYIYYGGYSRGHKTGRFTDRQIGIARMPVDRYVARAAGADGGRLRTPRVVLEGTALTVNAKMDGMLRVRLLDADGRPVPGCDEADCEPIRGDSVRHPVRWKGAAPRGVPVQLEFVFDRGELYAFDVVSGPGGLPNAAR